MRNKEALSLREKGGIYSEKALAERMRDLRRQLEMELPQPLLALFMEYEELREKAESLRGRGEQYPAQAAYGRRTDEEYMAAIEEMIGKANSGKRGPDDI